MLVKYNWMTKEEKAFIDDYNETEERIKRIQREVDVEQKRMRSTYNWIEDDEISAKADKLKAEVEESIAASDKARNEVNEYINKILMCL